MSFPSWFVAIYYELVNWRISYRVIWVNQSQNPTTTSQGTTIPFAFVIVYNACLTFAYIDRHWKPQIAIMPPLSSLLALKVVFMTTSDASGEDKWARWCHQMETFSRYWPFVRVTGEFPSQRHVTRSFEVFFALRLNKRLSKQPRRQWFQTPSRSLWRHCNGRHPGISIYTRVCKIWNTSRTIRTVWVLEVLWFSLLRHSFCVDSSGPCIFTTEIRDCERNNPEQNG